MYTWTEGLLSRIADVFSFYRSLSLLCSVFLFHHVNCIYSQKDCLCLRVWEQFSKREVKTEEKTAEERKKNLLIYRGRAECDLPALRIWWMAERLARQHSTLFCYLTSLLAFFSFLLTIALCWIKAFSVLVPKQRVQYRKLCTARTLG